jgi:succinyl-CoA synthetase beta subunit
MEIDLGFVGYITEDKAIKITINEFRGVEYIHIREYMRDVDMAAYLLDKAGDILTEIYLEKLGGEKQLDLFDKEKIYDK